MFGFNPQVILATIIALFFSAVLGYAKGHHDAAVSAEIKTQTAITKAIEIKDAKILSLQSQLETAQNEHVKQMQQVAADARAARTANDGLRQQLDRARSGLRAQPASTSSEYAVTLADVLQQCSVEYQRMAETADGHAGDVKLLQDSWPK